MGNWLLLALAFLVFPCALQARLPEIDAKGVQSKLNEMMKAHATQKKLHPVLVKRALQNYLELLDPTKTYLLQSDVKQWTDPDDDLLQQILDDYAKANYRVFSQINEVMKAAILRRRGWEQEVAHEPLPKKVDPDEFKEIPWAKDKQELLTRLLKIRSLQKSAVDKLEQDLQATSMQRIAKRQAYLENEILAKDPVKKSHVVFTNVLKATAAALDAHTSYFTPDEAAQFMIGVQQRLFGIGAQLRDDINGFTITKIVEGGPAAESGLFRLKDKIIAVNGEPVVGMDITDAVELIRGPENTSVTLTILREAPVDESQNTTTNGTSEKSQQKLDLTLKRGEVVIKEARYESSFEPFGNGVIGYLRLHSFYQDPDHSSTGDLTRELNQIKEDHNLKGVILDLRANTGGLLAQAVGVTGMFITKGVVVSIKDDAGHLQHLRDLDGKTIWDGPLIVLIDRASASASEIVAQALQDYGRAIVIGDDHSYGKGTFQTFTLNGTTGKVNPTGEYKVTRGIYYTVSGKTPQLVGVQSDLIAPGPYSHLDIGESFLKYPLENDKIEPNFEDKMLDVPAMQREALIALYRNDLQPQLDTYSKLLPRLKKNSETRVSKNAGYQAFLADLKKKPSEIEDDAWEKSTKNDPQLAEAYNVMKDLIVLMP